MSVWKSFRFLLMALAVYLTLVVLIFLIESNVEGSNIKTLYDSIWYSLVTLTTVGYGDFYPVTPFGKLLGLLFLIGSLGLLGLLIGEVGGKINDIRERKKMGYQGTKFKDHVIIIGWDDFARSIAAQLINAKQNIGIVTNKKDDIDLIYEEFDNTRVFVLFADLKNFLMLEKLNIQEASMIFINLKDDTDKLIATLNVKKNYPEINCMVTLDSGELKETFYSAGVTYVLSKNEIASKLIASYIFEPDIIFPKKRIQV